ncbi:Golgi-specific brefeldin A-resistance guanine nucleotide exchange factor 1-like [Polypterus senegalus]|uniref:Golgi-specific brefeldin A-resistance guanine nucleotide exchange factor 1-like n=1 Tax=Polypterus senegalus TaxID=55291 RepID=UPI001964574C|nr:Golgi-specific brefeldin A-resistance guanine nucleotide exchange factor 1-like [Polypterus senegalus]
MMDKNITIVLGEISVVVGAIRKTSRWNTHTPLNEEQDTLFSKFRQLNGVLNNIKELSDIEPIEFHRPFLEVIKSEDFTGPITELALKSVNKFLCYGLIVSSCKGAAQVINKVTEAVTHATFVGTDPAVDEIVLLNILQILKTLLLVPVGAYLTDESVCDIIKCCFQMCFDMSLSALLRKSCEQTLVDVVRHLFLRLNYFEEQEARSCYRGKKDKMENQRMKNVHSTSVESIPEYKEQSGSIMGHSDIISPENGGDVNPSGVKSIQLTQGEGLVLLPYGLPCIQELFCLLISLTNPHDIHNSEENIQVSLMLLTAAFETAQISKHGMLLVLVKNELCRHLFQLLTEHLNHFAVTIRLCFLLFENMRGHLKFQFEMYFKKLMDIIAAENTGIPYEMKELSLGAVVELLHIPSFLPELYINYDCDFYCSNLFEELIKLLSKSSCSLSGQLFTMNLLSLEALIIIIDTLAAHSPSASLVNVQKEDEKDVRLITELNCTEPGLMHSYKNPPMSYKHHSSILTNNYPWSLRLSPLLVKANTQICKKLLRFSSFLPTAQEVCDIKNKKKLLIEGTKLFNQKPEKGIQFLLEYGLLNSPVNNNEIALWLRENPGLDKKMIGEFISDQKNEDLLKCFVRTFSFHGLRIDDALRLYIEAFRLSGEAPVIQRLLEAFADIWNEANGFPFASNDATFLLAYAVIMLNTDQHNRSARKQNVPMTVEEFKKNLKGLNGSLDFDQNMLEDIYNAIKNNEIVMPDEQSGLAKENYIWHVVLHRGATEEGIFLHVPPGCCGLDLFTIMWVPTVAALTSVFDNSIYESVTQKTMDGLQKCALISVDYGLSDVFDSIIISLIKLTTICSESVDDLPIAFGSNVKAQLAAKTLFKLSHNNGNILRESWKSIIDTLLCLFRAALLPTAIVETEDFIEPNGKFSLQREKTPANREESSFSNFVSWLPLISTEQFRLRGRASENNQTKQTALDCIMQCNPEKLITESTFLQLESLQDLIKVLKSVTPDGGTYNEKDSAFCLELLIRIVLGNSDRVSCFWQTVRDHLCQLCVNATEDCLLVERAVVGLLRLAIRLLWKEEIRSEVLISLRIFLLMELNVHYQVSQEIAYGLHELMKTNAVYIHSKDDWYTVFSLLEFIGAGVKPSPPLYVVTGPDIGTGKLTDCTIISYNTNKIFHNLEIDAGLEKQPIMSQWKNDMDVADNNQMMVEVDASKPVALGFKTKSVLDKQSIVTLWPDQRLQDKKSFIKCVESLSLIVQDVVHVTPENLDLCIKTLHIFVNASLVEGCKVTPKFPTASSKQPSQCHRDDEEDKRISDSYDMASLQLLDLLYVLHTHAANIYYSWVQTTDGNARTDSWTLWSKCWCPLLQGIAWLCCDARQRIRMHALTYLQKALQVYDLQALDALEWESCFYKVLLPLLKKLLENISPGDIRGMDETRIKACTLLCKVFLQQLSPLVSLKTFATLWLTILELLDKYMQAGSSDMLLESIPEFLKNLFLVLGTAGIFTYGR